jgi:two-component system, NarL family, sensor histidine kinase UhpB
MRGSLPKCLPKHGQKRRHGIIRTPTANKAAVAESDSLENDALLEAESLVAHLHENSESEKSRLARELHDDLGGLMVSAVMDLSSATRRLAALDPEAHKKFERIRSTLESAIDLSRQMIEGLRPSILDNFGLFAALRWQLKRASRESGVVCTESYPDVEPPLESVALTALFRVAQEALAMSFKRGAVKSADLSVRIENGAVWMIFTDDGVTNVPDGKKSDAAMTISSMRHRIRVLGGTVNVNKTAKGENIVTAQMPMRRNWRRSESSHNGNMARRKADTSPC